MAQAINLGFSRIGANRELKKALETYWSGQSSADDLLRTAKQVRQTNWQVQREAGLSQIPVGDFSLYDHVHDTASRSM
jgi:5-methyltetrahydropteroyltriglutamate--homocysteine methyltransferase